ncbi:MAG: N-acetyltransferase family protein [Filomicrobium sp.]
MLQIREANEQDLPQIAAIYGLAVTQTLVTWDYEAPDLETMRQRFMQRTEAGFPYLVADTGDGELGGFACGSSFHPQPGFRFSVENSIYVAEHCRRQGVGRRLLEGLIAECESRGFRQMIAGISVPGGETSLVFHEALGFRKMGELPNVGWKHGQWLSALYLQRPLGDGAGTRPG